MINTKSVFLSCEQRYNIFLFLLAKRISIYETIIVPIYSLLLLSLSTVAQQTVHKKLNQILLEESFSELNDIWPVITNDDNFFVFDKGEYFMNRTKTETPYAIMANWHNDLNSFSIRASLMLGPAESSYQSLGLIFRASNDGQSALI